MCKIYLIAEMTRYIFVNNLKFIEPVMSLDSRDKQKQGRAAQSPPRPPPPGRSRKYGAHEHIQLPHFFATRRLHEQFCVCENFFCHIKVNTPAFQQIYITYKLANFPRLHERLKELSHKNCSCSAGFTWRSFAS